VKPEQVPISSPRESEVVLRLAAFRFLSAAQIAEFVLSGSRYSTRSREEINWRVLGSLKARALVACTPRMVGGPGGGAARLVYYLTPAGYRLARLLCAGIPVHRAKSPGTFLIRHALMTAEIALAFGRASASHEGHELVAWECDWQAALPLGASAVVPDGYLVYAVNTRRLHAFVEVDLGTEHTAFFARKIRRYLDLYRGNWRSRLPVWPAVLVVAEGEARATQLRRVTETVIGSQPDQRRLRDAVPFAFAGVGDVLGPWGPLGEVWEFAGRRERAALETIETRAGPSVDAAAMVIDR
jgi:hypothetical protein